MRTLAVTLLLALTLSGPALATLITNDTTVASGNTFDYIVAGAGLTGLVVGNKLSARGFSVLIVEAGLNLPDNEAIFNIQARGNLSLDPTTDCNWHYVASADNGTALPILIDSGKCVGGSTSINGAVWLRPTATELDAIEELGNPGWNSTSLFSYMTLAERNIPPTVAQRMAGANYVPEVHGYNGAVNVSFPTPMRSPTLISLYAAAVKLVLGMDHCPDLSARTSIVSAFTSWSIWYDAVANINRRSSAAFAWLYPESQQRDTLTVLTAHTVGSVIFKKHKATGFKFGQATGGPQYEVYARKEVILAAGSLATPPILERSGVGENSTLAAYGIAQLVNLPGVGKNLQDQPGTGLSALVQTTNASNTNLIDNRNIFAPIITLPSIDELFGEESNAIAANLNATIKKRAKAAVAAGTQATHAGALALFTKATELITKHKLPIAEFVGESYPAVFTSVFWPLLPLSRGHIHINTADPYARPQITPRFLTDAFDVDISVAISKTARDFYKASPFAPLVSVLAADAIADDSTDAEWAAWYASTAYGASHWVGSAAMLPRKLGGVVSPTLNVYGTKNLRIVDASILPMQLTCHTSSVLYATSQKAADLILADA